MSTLSAAHDHRAVRRGLLLGTTLSTLLAGYGLIAYPATLTEGLASTTYGLLLVLLLVGYAAIAFRMTQTTTVVATIALQHGARWGLLCSTLWFVEISAGNLGFNFAHNWIRLAYYGAIGAVLALTLVAGGYAALRTGRITGGVLAGFWSGLISGLIAFIILLSVTYLFFNMLLLDPQNIQEFQHSGAPDLATSIVGESLAGGINHLWLSPLVGAGLGMLGGIVGAGFGPARNQI
jgi:hypothetical protein